MQSVLVPHGDADVRGVESFFARRDGENVAVVDVFTENFVVCNLIFGRI